jgi:hypothetical protein
MKKNLVILANCQGRPLEYMLNKYYSKFYDIKYYSNFEYIKNNLDFPSDLKNADIFLYQNYSNDSEKYNLKIITENILKKDCIKISFPTLHSCNLIFCYNTDKSPNNNQTITEKKPFGDFFFGISVIIDEINKYNYCNNDKLKQNEIIENIIKKSNTDNFISEEIILYYNKRTFEFLEKKCLSSDIPEIYDFIKINFTKYRLWHNPNHPTGILLNQLIKLIFSKLQLDLFCFDNKETIDILDNSLSDWVMPIFPCVAEYYNFEFDINICSSWYNKNIVDFKTYLKEYLQLLTLNTSNYLICDLNFNQ